MWIGLQSLEDLNLAYNQITDIQRHGISHMPQLRTLHLYFNRLRILRADMFNPDKFHSRTYKLALYLANNPFQCNSDLCWLKEAWESGLVSLTELAVRCANLGNIYFLRAELHCTSGLVFLLNPITRKHSSRMCTARFCGLG